MATIEQFVFTDRERGKGWESTLDGGFQVAACSEGVLPEHVGRLATIAGEVGRLFLNAFGMNSSRSAPPFGTETSPLWCWTPLDENLWALTRSIYLGQSVSSSRPEGNYLFHAILMRPEDMSGFRNNPFNFAQFACKQDLFWSQDRGLTALNAIELPSTTKQAASIDLSKVHVILSRNFAKRDALAQLLSLLVSLRSPSRGTLLVNGLDADESWKLMGMVLFLLPAFVRSRISLSNVCFASFVQAATTDQAFVAMPRGVALAGSNRITNRIGQVDAATGQLDIADETRAPMPLMSWVLDHIDDLATKLYTRAEAAGLSSVADYEALAGVRKSVV